MVNERTIINREAVEYTRSTFADRVRVFDTLIKRSVRFPESQARHQTIFAYDPKGDGAHTYRQLANEVLHGKA